jgi:hypothetical protein
LLDTVPDAPAAALTRCTAGQGRCGGL